MGNTETPRLLRTDCFLTMILCSSFCITRGDLVFISCIDSCVDDVMIPSDLNFITMFALKQNGAIRCDLEFDLANIYYDHQVCKTHHYKSTEREREKKKPFRGKQRGACKVINHTKCFCEVLHNENG